MTEFMKAALIRAARTAAECALAYIGSAAMFHEVNWLGCLSAAGMGAVTSILMAIATGLPEVNGQNN